MKTRYYVIGAVAVAGVAYLYIKGKQRLQETGGAAVTPSAAESVRTGAEVLVSSVKTAAASVRTQTAPAPAAAVSTQDASFDPRVTSRAPARDRFRITDALGWASRPTSLRDLRAQGIY